MSWDVSGESQKTVYFTRNGQTTETQFEGNTPLKDAVSQIASANSLGSVIVRSDGREIQPDEGSNALSSFGRIEIVPKMAGAGTEDEEQKEISESSDQEESEGSDATPSDDTPQATAEEHSEETQ